MNPIPLILYGISLLLLGASRPSPPYLVMDAVGSDWLGPAYCGHGDVSHIELRFREATESRWRPGFVVPDITPFLPSTRYVTDLTPNTLYVIEVRGFDRATGQWSDWSTIAASTTP